jgi:hypothetical protein
MTDSLKEYYADMDRILTNISREMIAECKRATKKFGPFNSAHEGYAVILEELEELWDAIKDKKANAIQLRKETIQVGAMAMRFVLDCLFNK